MLDELFAKDKSGRIKEWNIVVASNPDGTASYTITHGLQTGKKTSTTRQVTVGKNIGKSNETSPYQQACSDAQSRWNKQIDKGYRTDVADIKLDHEVENFLPMLAGRFDKRGKKITWPAYVQPKLDGFRCLARMRGGEVTMWSRKGKVFDVPKELIAELKGIMKDEEVFDGELYVHEWRSPSNEADFQRISSAVKKYRVDTPLLEYHIYDRPVFGRTFQDRYVDMPFEETKRIKRVETTLVSNEAEMMEFYEKYISGPLPYEGLMVRNTSSPYLFAHRSTDLLKVKPFFSDEFRITGGSQASGDDIGTVVFRCIINDGEKEFSVRPKGTREVRKEYWDNLSDYIGRYLEVQYNGFSNDGSPRFPVGIKVREDWDFTPEEGKKDEVRLGGAFNPFGI